MCETFRIIGDFEPAETHVIQPEDQSETSTATPTGENMQFEEFVDQIYYIEDLKTYTEYDVREMLDVMGIEENISLKQLCLEIEESL